MGCLNPLLHCLLLCLLRLDLGNEVLFIVCIHLFSLCEIFIEVLEPLELGKHRLIKLIYTFKCLFSYGLLMVCKEKTPKIFIQEEISGVEGWLRL